MPRQARKPCSGCARSSRIRSHSAAVAGPIEAASYGCARWSSRRSADDWMPCAPVLVVAAHALMRGDPLTLVEDLDGASREAHLYLGADEAMRNAVIMRLDLDVIIDADPADPPLGEHVRALRQGLECRPVDLLQQLAAGHAEPPDRPFLVDPGQQLGDRRVDLSEAVESAVA